MPGRHWTGFVKAVTYSKADISDAMFSKRLGNWQLGHAGVEVSLLSRFPTHRYATRGVFKLGRSASMFSGKA